LTLIEGDNLTLNFDDGRVVLKTQDSHAFNCELPVVGTPSDADVLVINVMAKATKWEISSCAVATEFNKQLLPNEMAILIPLTDGCVFNGDVEMFAPGKHETLVVSGTCHLSCKSLNTKFLKAVLKNKSEK
ncbi:MAG: HutD family protein, partial [Alphaproteobacteria bacterium]